MGAYKKKIYSFKVRVRRRWRKGNDEEGKRKKQ
jgi:hypothetical protein